MKTKEKNPLQLDASELTALALVQQLAKHDKTSLSIETKGGDRRVNIRLTPQSDDHFYIGNYVVPAPLAAGLKNTAVWTELERTGLAKSFDDMSVLVTKDGLSYNTGLSPLLKQ